jgi:hypothetical protein
MLGGVSQTADITGISRDSRREGCYRSWAARRDTEPSFRSFSTRALSPRPDRKPIEWSGRLDSNQRPLGPETVWCSPSLPLSPVFPASPIGLVRSLPRAICQVARETFPKPFSNRIGPDYSEDDSFSRHRPAAHRSIRPEPSLLRG